ncbi:sugar porter family MFS transporter [Kitasatospora kifunensis]|uniref:Sugar porter (SP) family MFS transporter n=1 Tax=Kitasatospora kifunensis TaxID=58351 RepID=A0A7W7R9T9_KITKI|nr:sugar porter family MFS transporter [Kitasatospora kifunensis]MBB4928026.1 sugar porter (SP) family MFS transporter [Kitasatospora kifunensis]
MTGVVGRVLPVLVPATGGLLFGYGTGGIAGVLPLVDERYGLSAWVQGLVVSAALLGAALTAPTSGRLADRFGRRPVITAATSVFIVGTAVSALAGGPTVLILGRFLVGLALGAISFAVPLYLAEISPPARRGALVTLNQLMITIGLLLAYLVSYALQSGGAWRLMLAVGLVPAVALLGGMAAVPESPSWLVGVGRVGRARAAAAALGLPPVAQHPSASARQGTGIGLRAALAAAGPRRLALGLGIAVLVHLTGLNTAIYYAPTILSSSGLTRSGSVLGSVLVGACNVAATAVTIALLDRSGRRPLMLGGLAAMAAAAAAIAAAQLLGDHGGVTALLLCVFIVAGGVGPAPVFWVFVSEIYPRRARGALMSLATAAHWAADFVVASTFLPLVRALSLGGAFAVYSGVTLAAALLLFRWMPETKGIHLDDVQDAQAQPVRV